MTTDPLWDEFDTLPAPEVRRWANYWPAATVAWHDQHQHASQLVGQHVMSEMVCVGTWNMATSAWWAARHGPGAARYDCEHLENTPGPAYVWMPYSAMRWCLACWPLALTTYFGLGGRTCHQCKRFVRPDDARMRSLRYYEETMSALLCTRCATTWDTWGDGYALNPGEAWWAYRDQDHDAHDTLWRNRFNRFGA